MWELTSDDCFFLALSPAVALAYGAVCSAFMYADLHGLPAFLPKLKKVQPKPLPTREDYAGLWSVVLGQNLCISFFLLPPLTLMLYRLLGVQVSSPSLPQLVIEFVLIGAAYDTWFTVCHRLFHMPSFYHLHKRHHTWKAPCAFEGGYFDALDFIVGNYGPMLWIPPFITRHFFTILLFGVLGALSVAVSHSGYDFESTFWFLGPIKPTVRHDAHHEFFNVNYSHFGFWDWLFGTLVIGEDAAAKRRAAGANAVAVEGDGSKADARAAPAPGDGGARPRTGGGGSGSRGPRSSSPGSTAPRGGGDGG
mmetsp:Transcript_85132/g.274100  ORF Transcript_85132/g.274100 Transcript_85132/m.274100 type:complete len:307 (-) Transcript_85132:7-927(-)